MRLAGKSQSMLRILTFIALAQTCGLAQSAENLKINEKDSYIIFIAKNLGVSVSGKISGMKVTGHYDEGNILQSKLTGTLDVTTLNTGIDLRDNHLRSKDYFDAKKHSTITFNTKSIITEGSSLVAIGDLTIKGVTKEERIKFTVERKEAVRIFTGDITIQRRDYKLGGNSALVMADTIRVRVFVVRTDPKRVILTFVKEIIQLKINL
jgi:polyisoprenoid-binding protein YceI